MKNDKSQIVLSVVIVNYNTAFLIRSCLDSLYFSLNSSALINQTEIIVVDNASTDDSYPLIKKKYPDVVWIQNSKNVGFAKANNQGIERSSGKYVLLLNTDARVSEDALEKSIQILHKDVHIGVVSGKLVYENGKLQKSLGFFPHIAAIINWMFFIDDIPLLNNLLKPYHVENPKFYTRIQRVDWVSGAYFMVKREILNTVGLLDNSIFMYGEEVELCFRIKNAGYEVVYDPSFTVIHDKGGSSLYGKEAGIIEEFQFLSYFYKKCKPVWQQKLIKTVLKLGIALRVCLFGIIPKYNSRKVLYEKALNMA